MRHRLPLVLCLSLSLSPASVVWAQGLTDARFEQGRALRRERRDTEAMEHFRRMYADTREPRALAQQGLAEGALGRWAEAETHLTAAMRAPDAWVLANRTAGAALEAQQRLIASHLGSLEVVCEVPGASVWVGDRLLGTLPLSAPLRLEAGRMTVEVRAEGHTPTLRETTLIAGGYSRETIVLTRTAPLTLRAAQTVAPPVGAPSPAAGSTQRTLAWAAAGGALLLAGGGVVAWAAGAPAADRWNDDARCLRPNLTREEVCGSDGSTARTMSALAVTGLALGGTLAVTSAVLFLVSSGGGAGGERALACGPATDSLGLACAGRF